MVTCVDLIVFTMKIASAAEVKAMSFSEIEFWVERGLQAGVLSKKK